MSPAIDRFAVHAAAPLRVRDLGVALVSRRHVDFGRSSSAICRA
ncbi:MAG TPA: hypothetical protein VL551_26905 [Actinospica sp.]|jgi:hypothetical protein|nr:hypothetical protein [Actinospica sp.]